MSGPEELKEILAVYLTLFPGERERIQRVTDFVGVTTAEGLYSRKNFNGHITTSAFIVNLATSEMLLLRHKVLNRWLQPGGHAEGDSSLQASALREAVEETEIPADALAYMAVSSHSDVPFDIDPHHIPANAKKEEDEHYHLDFRYIFAYTGGVHSHYNPDESTGLRWVKFEELKNDATFAGVIIKLEKFLSTQAAAL